MKRIFLFIIQSLVLFCSSIHAKNFDYNGIDIIMDRPQGELKYYSVDLEWFLTFRSIIYDGRIVPFVFTEDGKVYTRGLFYEDYNVWMEGRQEDGDMIFECGSPINFDYFRALSSPDNERAIKTLSVYSFDYDGYEYNYERDNSISSIRFRKDANGDYMLDLEDNKLVGHGRVLSMKPVSVSYVTPPTGFPEELYQINFIPYRQTIYSSSPEEDMAALRIKAIRTDSKIYLQGLSQMPGGDPEMWIEGEIQGDKVIFRNGLDLGVGRNLETMYLTPMTFRSYYGSNSHLNVYYTATGTDLIFDYDKKTGRLSNPSSCFGFTQFADESWDESLSVETMYWGDSQTHDFFMDAEIFPIPEKIEFKPLPPKVKRNSPYNEISYTYQISYIDANGYMMDPDNMYFEIFIGDEPHQFTCVNINNWEFYESEVKPFADNYIGAITGALTRAPDLSNWVEWTISDEANVLYDLSGILYYDDGSQSSNSKVETILGDFNNIQERDTPIYDLMGRKVDPKNLHKGVYIRDGKKFYVKD